MDPTYTLKPQLRIKITNIYLDEAVTLIQYIKLTSSLLCYDDVQLYVKLYMMYHYILTCYINLLYLYNIYSTIYTQLDMLVCATYKILQVK